MPLTYHPAAEAELAQAAVFYEQRSAGLGDRFLNDFDLAARDIESAPHRWPKVMGDLRYRSLTHFPFGVYYRLLRDEVRILIIKHHSRHPSHGRDRLND